MGYFDSFADFVAMGGHGPYVWSAYGVSLSVLLWLVLRPIGRRRQILRQLKRQQRRQVTAAVEGRNSPT